MKNNQCTTITYIIVMVGLVLGLILLPTGFESALQFKDAEKCRALILETDESRIIDTGIIRTGQQVCQVKFLSGKFKGRQAEGWNLLTGSLATDKIFHKGDKVQCVVHQDENKIISVNLIDYYRLHGELLLSILFALFLIVFARSIGARSVLSFALTVLVLWKVMVPLFLKGAPPVATGLLVTAILTFTILFLVYGFDRRLLASFGGAMLGVCFSALLSVVCTKLFKIHGAVMSYSEPLLYSGFIDLNLTHIFMASICVGASGSVMDLSVDITSAVFEVVRNCPEISRREAIRSGVNVARSAMGTMTTTLLLAYSGTSIALLMTFMAQGTPLYNILNNNIVAAEILNTIAGSFGLASTAPFTAVLAGMILTKKILHNSNNHFIFY